MLASARIPLGAPGIYPRPDYVAPRLDAQRMDQCAFVGVAPRGPAYVPVVDERNPGGYAMMSPQRARRRSVAVAVRSFDEYRRLYGAFEGPGLLAHAVASYFEQGGRRACIVRIVSRRASPALPGVPAHLEDLAQGEVRGLCTVPLGFLARDEGAWGNAMHVEMGFTPRALGFAPSGGDALTVDRPASAPVGTFLRFSGAHGERHGAFVRGQEQLRDPMQPVSRWRLAFDSPLPFVPVRADIVEAWISVKDGAGNAETFEGLALHPDHPRSLASVLCDESRLVWPHYAWSQGEVVPASLAVESLRARSGAFAGGNDAYAPIVPEDFFDPLWSFADDAPGEGITALAGLDDVTHLVVPDLYVPAQWARDAYDVETRIDQAGNAFGPCVHAQAELRADATPASALTGLILDPRTSADLARIAELQSAIVAYCEDDRNQDLIALIDVPPGLSQGQAERWRSRFDSSWCAAYHPWLVASRRLLGSGDDSGRRARALTPSAVAAGIVARKELARGIQFGPANEIAASIVDLAEKVPPGREDAFHPQGLNCFVRETDGIHLVSARTLSRDPRWRQLSVRRLVLMLRRTLLRETQWAVFEPNGPELWRDLRIAIENLLRRLFRVGAFAGATESESFFVRVREDRVLLDRGELVVEIGVAPAEPIEFIVLRLRREGDGTLTLEE
ncbi:hypothetical protein BWI17_06260 [Betaproteobacteria bacterium GR16-43]|nr:hypothetical protein BWI17_06260 [Betaproteobacteria bacterium GR16-43]